MSNVTRRRFLISGAAGLATACTGISFDGGMSWAFEAPLTGESFDFRMLTLGSDGHDFKGPLHNKPSTLVTEIDFKKGLVRQSQIPMSLPHAPQYLPGGRILALSAHARLSLVLDKDHKVLRKLEVPPEYFFAGHGLVLEDRGWLAISVKKRISDSVENSGYITFLDLATFEEKHRLATHSTFGHDIERLSKTELAVSHYGTLFFDFQKTDRPITKAGVKYLMNVVKPMVSYIDIERMQFTEHRVLDQFHALNHIAHGPEKSIYGISVQAVGRDPASVKYAVDRYKDAEIPEQRESDSGAEKFAFLPSQLTLIPRKGANTEFLGKPSRQVRGHDLTADPTSHWAAATFPGSRTVGIIKNRGAIDLIPGSRWGLHSPRAIGLSPDAKRFVVVDQQHGIVVVDRETLKVVTTAMLPLFKTVHVETQTV